METGISLITANSNVASSRWIQTVRRWMNEAQATLPEPHMARISHLYDFELIYIYHHLSEGTEVSVHPQKDPMTQQWRAGVFFRHYQLGWLVGLSEGFATEIMEQPEGHRAFIHSIRRQKYLPPQQLSIAIFSRKTSAKSDRK